MKIRPMGKKDLNEIVIIAQKSSQLSVRKGEAFWNIKELSRWIKDDNNVCLVATKNDTVIGFVTSLFNKSARISSIENLYVKKIYRGQGIGKQLLESCVERLKKRGARYIFTLVKINNNDAIKFFKKNGFKRGYEFVWMTGYDKL